MDPIEDMIAKIPPYVLAYAELAGYLVTVLVIMYVTLVGV